MFKKLELVNFDNEKKESFYYIITTTKDFIDMSIFDEYEIKILKEMDNFFYNQQEYFRSLSDNVYNTNENYKYKEAAYYFDAEMYKYFNVNFRDLDIIEDNKENLKLKYEELKFNNIVVTKDKLRKWIVENFKFIK